MFTGIVEKKGEIISVVPAEKEALVFKVKCDFFDLELGESVAVNGVCLTVIEPLTPDEATFFVSRETLKRSNLVSLKPQSVVNLERAMKLGERISGHLVQGHVDGVARLEKIESEEEGSFVIHVSTSSELGRYLVEKGSVTLDGVSLTIASIEKTKGETRFTIQLIPHTWKETRFSDLEAGAALNLEVDVIAKYVESLLITSE